VVQVLDLVRESMPYISGVTVSGGEATVQYQFVAELFQAIKGSDEFKALSTFIDSNGNTPIEVWEQLSAVTDGVMLDLKSLDNQRHIDLTGSSNESVLESIRYLSRIGILYEVRLLLIPGHNDSDEQLINTAAWLKGVDPTMRITVNAFKTHGVRAAARDWQEVTDKDMDRYLGIIS
jgi:pyruvate-formate lyase-activating enzyme